MTAEREGLADPVAAKVTQVLRDRGWLDSGDAADAGPEVAAHLADLLAARDRRVRVEAVREAADDLHANGLPIAAFLLRDRADRIEADA